MIFIVNGVNAAGSFVMRSPVPWNMAVPPDGINLAYNSLRMSASDSVLNKSEVSWIPLASLPVTLGWNNLRPTETFSADNDDVFVWEHVGLFLVNFRTRFEHCVVIKTDIEPFLDDIPNNLPLCGGSEREPSLSEDLRQLLGKITASQTKDGVRQIDTFVDEHCVRHTVRVRHNVRRAQEQDSLDRHVHGEHVQRSR